MSTPGSNPESGRRRSDVLDAIFEAVEEKPAEASTPATHLFRAKALAQVDIPKQIDNLLPITSPKIWLAIAGVAGVLVAAIIYAAGTPQVTSVTATGRAVAESGVVTVGTIDEVALNRIEVTEGIEVRQGELLAEGTGNGGATVTLTAPSDGTIWQILASPGQALAAGTSVFTILPPGSDTQVLVPVSQDLARGLQVGQTAQILGSGFAVSGTVTEVSETPLPSDRASDLVNVTLDPADSYVTVLISTDETVTPGAQVTVQIIESESTLLSELVNVG
jgi:multidrug efflux pump subunit AcrA (membrane-fusion protein)